MPTVPRGVAAAATVTVMLAFVMRSFGGSEGPSALTVAPTSAPRSASPAPSSLAPSSTVPTSTVPTSTVPTSTVVSAAPSSTAVVPASAPVDTVPVRFEAHGATYAVGAKGDIVVVGDWDCDGVVGAALLQPADGDVYVFDRLASPNEPVTGRLVGQVSGAVELDVIEQDNGCWSLSARRADGSPQVIATGVR